LLERSALNSLDSLALAHADWEIRRSYDTAELDPAVIADASRTDHPLPPPAGRRVTDQEHAGPLRTPSPPPLPPLPPPGDDATYHTYRADLAKVRALVLQQARAAGLAEGRANDLVLAVSEVAANTLRHTQSEGTLTIWRQAGEVVCEIQDEGTISDPLAGQRRPGPDATGGHGLWLVYQVCDLVELRSDETGTIIRMHMAIELPDLAAGQLPTAGG
jgi:anti-sigma regulatory factor (Ser/Thr protein kinase)